MLLTVCLIWDTKAASAQTRFTVSGIVKDAQTGETLIGATVATGQQKTIGVTTNAYGFYSIGLAPGQFTIVVSYVGYKTAEIAIDLKKNTLVNVALVPNAELKEVTISAGKSNDGNVRDQQMSLIKLDPEQINNIPVLLGEKDILKTMQLLPGVKSTGEANSGIYIRGGGADQNLVLLDGAQVYNATHLFGFFSIFNSDAIKDVSLYKGGMPANYGGRQSSVLDIKMDEGNNQRFAAQGGVGLISSRFKVEGPLVKGKSSFMLSARRTYADVFLKLSGDSTLKGSSLYFYDLNAKLNYQLGDKDRVYLSGYYGKDAIGLKDNFSTNWGNATASLRWNHIYGNKVFGNTSLIYSNYKYRVKDLDRAGSLDVASKIKDLSFKEDLTWFAGDNHKVNFGLDVTQHRITPDDTDTEPYIFSAVTKAEERKAYETAVYVAHDLRLGTKLAVTYGVRANWFSLRGPGTFYTYNTNGKVNGVATYADGEAVQNYINIEPRFTAGYTFDARNAIKLSYNRNSQNIHLLSNSTAALPSDVYVLSSNNIKPGITQQIALGYYRNIQQNMYEFSAETYYKRLDNEIDYKDNALLLSNNNIEADLIYGTGRAYGVELFFKKRYGRLNGWIGYTLSRVERRFNEVNNGNYFPARHDRTHDLSLVGIYKLKDRVTLSAVFIYGTGNAVTFPDGKYRVGGVTTYYYSGRNGYRLPANHRMDIGVTLDGKNQKKMHSSWTFGVYNLYNRKNPYSVVFKDTNDSPSRTEAVATSLFGIIPSVTWNFKF